MDRPPLPKPIRRRVAVVIGCSVLLTVLLVPLGVVVLASDDSSLLDRANAGFLLLLPVLGFVAAWSLVRRARADPERLLRRPNDQARRLLLLGKWVGLVVGVIVIVVVGHGTIGYVAGWATFTAIYCVVFALARREDPRLHWWRRMDASADR